MLTGARSLAQENAALKAEVEHSQKNAPMTAWADRIEEMNRKVMRLANIHSALTEKEEVRCCPSRAIQIRTSCRVWAERSWLCPDYGANAAGNGGARGPLKARRRETRTPLRYVPMRRQPREVYHNIDNFLCIDIHT